MTGELIVTEFLEPGTPIEILRPEELWMYEFSATTGVVVDIDLVMAHHYKVRLDGPIKYGTKYTLDTILLHVSRLKKRGSD